MLDFERAIGVALGEIDAFTSALHRLDEAAWENGTRCEEWTVRRLAQHFAAVIWQQAEAFHRARLDIAEPPSYLEVRCLGDALVSAIQSSRAHLVMSFELLPRDIDVLVPLPFAPGLPSLFALHGLVIEYGLHRNDLEWATGNLAELPDDVADSVLELLPGFLPGLATRDADPSVGYHLAAPGHLIEVAWRYGSWQVTAGAQTDVPCEIRGTRSSLALFATGRISAEHDSLEVRDPRSIAHTFQEYFPGL